MSDDALRGGIVVRSPVETVSHYSEYKDVLRWDFWYACAYCSTSEVEASAKEIKVRFEIDHYVPRSIEPDLTHTYDNLMFACEDCNAAKSDWAQPRKPRD